MALFTLLYKLSTCRDLYLHVSRPPYFGHVVLCKHSYFRKVVIVLRESAPI
ncbi:unnamed protein product [Amoebophrya sp. A25]|nr:unnamed protein product [Amoebophrya sp. A25]|eukprot:GSA25T00006279001.1